MCKKTCRIMVGSVAAAMMFAASLPSAWAITAGSAGPDWPVSVRVGDTSVPVGMEIVNTSSTGDVAGDTGQAKITSIKLVASCGTSTFPCTSAEPGVFQVNGPGVGSDGCVGISFLISAPDVNNEITLTPDADVILDRFETCRIDFTADVLAAPATDADLIADGLQTYQKGFMAMEKTISAALTGTGTGTDITTVEFCGDGIVNDDEDCDDGNQVNTDECRNDCTLPVCGDGIVDAGEACDDGNQVNTDECRNDCTLPVCGDGIVDPGEECDDGNDVNGDGCDADCTVPEEGDQGCTPGFWKGNADNWEANAWPVSPGTLVSSVFTIPGCVNSSYGNLTLLEALSLKGGSGVNGAAQILLRIGTGAYLNALSDCVEYAQSAADVVSDVNAALASCNRSTILGLAATLDFQNNAGCPLDQHGSCEND